MAMTISRPPFREERLPLGKLPFETRIEGIARDVAEFSGFSEAMNYSFESPKVFDKLLIPADSELRKTVEISNPLGEDFSVMRTTASEWHAFFSGVQL